MTELFNIIVKYYDYFGLEIGIDKNTKTFYTSNRNPKAEFNEL